MKKLLTIAGAVAVTVAGAMAAIDWNSVDNLAKGASVTVSSKQADAALITDGNYGNRWQAYPQTHEKTHDWVLLDLGEAKTFSDVEVKWEASRASQYDVYAFNQNDVPQYTSETLTAGDNVYDYKVIPEDWFTGKTPIAKRNVEGEGGEAIDSFTLEAPVTAQYLLVYCNEYNGNGASYGCSIFEISLANIEGRDEISTLSVSETLISEGSEGEVEVKALSKIGGELDITKVTDLALTCSDPAAVEITPGANGKFTVKGLKYGSYTLTATGKVDDREVSGTGKLTISYVWKGDNLAEGKAIMARKKITGETPEGNSSFALATDGNEDTYYEYNGDWGGGDCWVIVDLGETYLIEDVVVSYGGGTTGGRYFLAFAENESSLPASDADLDKTWGGLGLEGWTQTDQMARTANAINAYTAPKGTKARYIAVSDGDNPGGKPQVKEIYVSGKKYENPVFSAIELGVKGNHFVTGENVELTVKTLDQYGSEVALPEGQVLTFKNAEGETVTVENNVFVPAAKGAVKLTAECGDITSNTAEFSVEAAAEDYVAFKNYTVKFGEETNTMSVLEKNNNEKSFVWPFKEGQNVECIDQDLEINLGGEYAFELVNIRWENAIPNKYDVTFEDAEGNRTVVNFVSARGMGAMNQDRIYNSAEGDNEEVNQNLYAPADLDKVQKIYIHPLTTGSGYAVSLYDIQLYVKGGRQLAALELSADETVLVGGQEGEKATFAVKGLDQFGDDFSLDGRNITYDSEDTAALARIEDGVFTAGAMGTYTFVAKCNGMTSNSVELSVVTASERNFTPLKERYTAAFDKAELGIDGAATEKDIFNKDNTAEQAVIWAQADIEATNALTVKLNNSVDLDMMELVWEGACPTKYMVTLYDDEGKEVSTANVEIEREAVNGATFVDRLYHVEAPVAEGRMLAVFKNGVNMKSVRMMKIQPLASSNEEWGTKLLHIKLYSETPGDNVVVGVKGIGADGFDSEAIVDVFNLQGVKVRKGVKAGEALIGLGKGIYIVNGKKVVK